MRWQPAGTRAGKQRLPLSFTTAELGPGHCRMLGEPDRLFLVCSVRANVFVLTLSRNKLEMWATTLPLGLGEG